MAKGLIVTSMYSYYLKDLISSGIQSVSIHHINWWLMKYETEFYDAIPKSDCGKWSKWVKDNTIHVFPCVCPIRVQDCIFIELYFELLRISELETKEVHFGRVLEEYTKIAHNEDAISLWLEKYQSIWQNSHFNEVIRIKIT